MVSSHSTILALLIQQILAGCVCQAFACKVSILMEQSAALIRCFHNNLSTSNAIRNSNLESIAVLFFLLLLKVLPEDDPFAC